MGKKRWESDEGKQMNERAQDGGVVRPATPRPRNFPTSFTPDSDDEAGQMIAVSRQCRHEHTLTHTHKCLNTHKPTVRQSQLSTSVPLQDTDVLPSQLVSAHTHTKLAANVHTLAHTHSATLTAAL